jgi:hypothetical protein
MADEGVHEIQLNGKQLVFMFMAVTVVAVVIFLCGVMVGRGVRAPRPAEAAENAAEAPTDPTQLIQSSPLTPPPATDTASATGPTAPTAPSQEKLTYSERLTAPSAPSETLHAAPIVEPLSAVVRTPPEPVAPKPLPAPAKTGKEPKQPKEKPSLVENDTPSGPSGSGFVVQVAAVRARSEADTIAKRLQSKGFPSYVTTPGPGAAGVFRVRVGKYTDKREAESIARRLEKEEQFKPWITR